MFRSRLPYTRKSADLHLHTTVSDGMLSPEEIVAEARRVELTAIAITDHDVLDGIDLALPAGEKYGIEIIPGIELSAEYRGEEVHILGYYIDRDNDTFQRKLEGFRESRRVRAMEIVDKLGKMGMKLDYDEVLLLGDSDSIGRPHVATALVNRGYVFDKKEAFDRYLHDNGPAYVPKKKLTPDEAIAMILDVGGIPVLAHPGMLRQSIIPDMVSLGLMGLEVFHPNHSDYQLNYLRGMAERYGLLITGGSDYHGDTNGRALMGSIRLPYRHVEALKEAQRDLAEKLGAALGGPVVR